MPHPWKDWRSGRRGLWATWSSWRYHGSLQGPWTRWSLKVSSNPFYDCCDSITALHIFFPWEWGYHRSHPKGCEGSETTPNEVTSLTCICSWTWISVLSDHLQIHNVVTTLFLASLIFEAHSSQGWPQPPSCHSNIRGKELHFPLQYYSSTSFTSNTGPALKSFKQLVTTQTKLGATRTRLWILFCSFTSLGSPETFSCTGKDCHPFFEFLSFLMRNSHTLSLDKEFPWVMAQKRKIFPL